MLNFACWLLKCLSVCVCVCVCVCILASVLWVFAPHSPTAPQLETSLADLYTSLLVASRTEIWIQIERQPHTLTRALTRTMSAHTHTLPYRPIHKSSPYQGQPFMFGSWAGHCSQHCVSCTWKNFIIHSPPLVLFLLLPSLCGACTVCMCVSNGPHVWMERFLNVLRSPELGTFGTFEFFIKLTTYFCISPI